MRTAVRGHENPALDIARREARAAGQPLVVAAFVLASHTHPTERRVKFWLEGLRDAQAELRHQARLHDRAGLGSLGTCGRPGGPGCCAPCCPFRGPSSRH